MAKSSPMQELGQHGLPQSAGYINDEPLRELQGYRGMQVYREMSDNDPVCGAFIYAMTSHLRGVEWPVSPSEKDTEGEYSEFVEECMTDMENSWGDFISEALTMSIFGFSFFEKVYKKRVGPFEKNLSYRSRFTDGKIGIRKLASRAQETLSKWAMDENDNPIGFIQQPWNGGNEIIIPFEKGLLFRTTVFKNNPEGKSLLRGAYTSWYYKKNIQSIEAIGIERELAGLPVVRIPNAILKNAANDSGVAATLSAYTKIARDLKFNKQGSLVLPSDPFLDATGKPTNIRKVDIELLASAGTRAIDTNAVISRYDKGMATSVLASFLMLNGDKGSFALSKNQSDLFLKSLQCLVDGIAEVLNKDLLPELWQLNGFDIEMMPCIKAGNVAKLEIEQVADFIQKVASGGLTLAGDIETENHLRSLVELPEVPEEEGALRPMDPEFSLQQAESMMQLNAKYNPDQGDPKKEKPNKKDKGGKDGGKQPK